SPSLDADPPGQEAHHHVEHTHGGEAKTVGNELDKLRVLLPHWIEHNAEHAESFCTWAERARAAGDEHLAAHIEEAAGKIEAANRDLEGAIEHIGATASDHAHLEHDHPHSH
ncbi:MAG: hypothetical protein U9R72_08245, partial [Chloroflexota bacterium]|nr:hypothetical protein [Chloroflexota bacterium]